eukprot:GFUD01125420.1.p1 GENE.GFUD01125420.1~~GFUD01125420.1.p1  ORF type:complete len:170 (-),score=42.85 GFUD01125420.1:80-589(-)
MTVTAQSQLLIICLVAVGISSLALPQADTTERDDAHPPLTTTTTTTTGETIESGVAENRRFDDVKNVMKKMDEKIETAMDNFKEKYEMKILIICVVLGILSVYNVLTFIKGIYDKYLSIFCCFFGDSKSSKSEGKKEKKSKGKKSKRKSRSKSSSRGSRRSGRSRSRST